MAKKDEDAHKIPEAVEVGRKGGIRGGPARADALSARRRHEIAVQGGKARWKEDNLHADDDPEVVKKFRDLNP